MAEDPAAVVMTADSELAELIVDELVEAGLLAEGARKRATAKFVSGKLKSEDWRSLLLSPRAPGTEVEP